MIHLTTAQAFIMLGIGSFICGTGFGVLLHIVWLRPVNKNRDL